MKGQQLIREFKRQAREAGKVLEIEHTRKAVFVTCGDRRVKLSCNSRDIDNVPQYFKRLGL
ncbi:MAG: hypothetical protein WAO98_02630 [Alphaproteobacteria bacterium]